MSYTVKAITVSIVCFIYCIVYETILKQSPAPCNSLYALGVVCNCVALSVIASCVFYLITDYFPKRHQKRQIESYVHEHLSILSLLGKNSMIDLVGINGYDQIQLYKSCTKDLISPVTATCQQSLCFKGLENWFDYFETISKIVHLEISKLTVFESNMPVEVKLAFTNLENEDTFINSISEARKMYNKNTTMRMVKSYSTDIYNYLNILSNLRFLYNNTSKI